MARRSLLLTVLVLVAGAPGLRAETPREMYVEALAREHVVRTAITAENASPAVLLEVRAVVAAYRAEVRRYPGSGYSDNALWQAGRLSLDAFLRFDQPQDMETAVRLLRALVVTYPTSKLVKQVPEQLARVGAALENGDGTPQRRRPGLDSRGAVTAGHATLREIRRTVLPDAVRVIIELDAEVSFHEERLDNPARVFVDLAATRAAPALVDQTLRFSGDADIVRQVRVGRHPNRTTRVVLDAIGIASYSVYPLYNPYRLVIDCMRATSQSLLATRVFGANWGRGLPAPTPQSAAAVADAVTALATPPPDPSLEELPRIGLRAATRNAGGGFSISRQLGLGVSRIVIDPGHGGHDPGARGKGVDEAELVLDIALRLEKLLKKTPATEVILTRRADDFVSLQERTAIANREAADLFLSIHANASDTDQARGIETYYLNFANSMSAASVAARENAASGQTMGALPDFVKAIALNNKLDESRDFAAQVQRAMMERLRGANKGLKDLGVKQAPFVVLIGAAMPSVLAEISFVTNPQEARLLRGSAYRQRIAEALLNAIRKYRASLRHVPTVAQQ